MLRLLPFLTIALIASLLLAACAGPAPSPGPTTPTPKPGTMGVSPRSGAAPAPQAGTPTPNDLQPIRQVLRDMQGDMIQLHTQMAQIQPEQLQQMGLLMADLMDETAQFMLLVEQVMDQLTPEERAPVTDDLQSIQATLQEMQRSMQEAMPMVTPVPMEPGQTDLEQMARQMEQMHQQMRSQMQQMDSDHMTTLTAHVGDLTGQMAQLLGDLELVLDQVSPEDRQALMQQAQRMQSTVQQMMQMLGLPPGTPMPATGTPTGEQPQVMVSDQMMSDGTIVVDRAVVPEPGWVAIHMVQPDGSPGEVIGAAWLYEGVNTQVTVQLDRVPTEETELMAMLHRDTGEPATFNFPGGDPPLTMDGQLVITSFTVSP